MCIIYLGHWIILFFSILVVQIGTMKCSYCPPKKRFSGPLGFVVPR